MPLYIDIIFTVGLITTALIITYPFFIFYRKFFEKFCDKHYLQSLKFKRTVNGKVESTTRISTNLSLEEVKSLLDLKIAREKELRDYGGGREK